MGDFIKVEGRRRRTEFGLVLASTLKSENHSNKFPDIRQSLFEYLQIKTFHFMN